MTQSTQTIKFVDNAPLILAFLLLVDSLHFVFARLLLPHLPPATSAMYVLLVGTVEMAVFLALRGDVSFHTFRRHARFFLSIGFLVAAATTLSYTAVAFIDPGTASLLSQSTTLFAVGISILWLGERLNRSELLGAAVALIGVFAISFQPGDFLRIGSLIVLAGAFMYALHAAVVKRNGGEIEFGNFFLFRLASTTAFLFLFSAGRGQLAWPTTQTWLLLLLVGSVDVVLSRVLYYMALRRVRMSFHAIVLTLSPVMTILWSLILFGSKPTAQGMVGGAGVILGVAIVTLRHRAQTA